MVIIIYVSNVLVIKSQLTNGPSYVIVQESIDCYTLVRRLNKNSNIEGLFIHSDDVYDPDKIKIKEDFINGYCKIESKL